MDVYCQKCGEPWDLASVQEFEQDDYEGAKKDFYDGVGCPGCGWGTKKERLLDDSDRSLAMRVAVDIMGDDEDGIASAMDDFEFLFGGTFSDDDL